MFFLGRDGKGSARFASSRSHLLVLGPPRSGKTTAVVVPNVKLFPGPVVATSTKADVLAAVGEARSRDGTVFVFDPGGEVGEGPWTRIGWSPVDAAGTLEKAVLVTESFVRVALGPGLGGDRHWVDRAKALLAPLLLAANLLALPIGSCLEWVDLRSCDEALDALAFSGMDRAVAILRSVTGTEERERSAIFSTASSALAAYRLEQSPADGDFDPEGFVFSRDTLVVVASSLLQQVIAPVVVCLIDEITRACYRSAQRGRPARIALILDEMANIAPMPTLGSLLSEGVGQGVYVLGALQDLSQARLRWPELVRGLFTLFGTTMVIGGIGDVSTLGELEELFGVARGVERSWQGGGGLGGLRAGYRYLERPALSRHQLRGLGPFEAAVLELRGSPGMVALDPGFAGA